MTATKHDYRQQYSGAFTITMPRGMHPSDFNKCLQIVRHLGTFNRDSKSWTVKICGTQGSAAIRELISRGAVVTPDE